MSDDREVVGKACRLDGFDVVVPLVAAALLEAAGREGAADLLGCVAIIGSRFPPGEARWTVYAPAWLFSMNRDAFVELRGLIIEYAPNIA